MATKALKTFALLFKPRSYGFYMHSEYLAFKCPDSRSIQNLSYRWIRAQCICPRCRDPATGIRYHLGIKVPKEAAELKGCTVGEDVVDFNWADGHAGKVPISVLKYGMTSAFTNCSPLSIKSHLRNSDHSLWNQFEPRNEVFDNTLNPDGNFQDSLLSSTITQSFFKYGIARISKFPTERPEESLRFALALLRVPTKIFRENFVHNVHTEVREQFLNSSRQLEEIPFRTEYAYLSEQVPEISATLCVENGVDGGDVLFADAYSAILKVSSDSLDQLIKNSVMFRFENRSAFKPMLTMRDGQLCITYSPSFMEGPLLKDYKEMNKFYAAVDEFEDLLNQSSRLFQQRMQPGDLVIWDNRRILFKRKCIYPNEGKRHFVSTNAEILQ